MVKNYFSLPLILILLQLMFNISCTTSLTGTGTDTSTRDVYATVTGTLIDDNKPSANSIVALIPFDYNPVIDSALASFAFDTTDKNGNYSISNKSAGLYNIIAVSENNSKIVIKKRITLNEKKTYTLSSDTLKKGNQIRVYPNNRIIGDSAVLFFKGSLFKVKASESVSFLNQPVTTTSLCYSSKNTGLSGVVLKDSIDTDKESDLNIFSALIILKNPADTGNKLIVSHFKQLGFDTITSDGLNLSTINLSKVDLIFIAPSTDNKNFDTILKTIQIPIINCKNLFYNDLGFTANDINIDFGNIGPRKSIFIYNSNHPITKNITGYVDVFGIDKTMNYGNVKLSSVLATSGLQQIEPVLFCFDKNDTMSTTQAPARRVGFFVDSHYSLSHMNETGWTLFDRAALWSVGRL